MNINGIELTGNQSRWLVEAVRKELKQWQDSVGHATTDIGTDYCREQVRQCQELLLIVTENVPCSATDAAESGS